MPNICSQHDAAFRSTIFYPDTGVLFSDWLICSHMSFFDWLISSPGAGLTPIAVQTSCFTFHCIYSGVAWRALHIWFSWSRNTRCGSRNGSNACVTPTMCETWEPCIQWPAGKQLNSCVPGNDWTDFTTPYTRKIRNSLKLALALDRASAHDKTNSIVP